MMRWHEWVVLIAGSTGSALRAVRPPNLYITPASRRDLVAARQYVDAAATQRGPKWVKLRRTQYEQMSSGLPLKADIAQCGRPSSETLHNSRSD
jgi:hypothetical protein